jgi:hypothetical protein
MHQQLNFCAYHQPPCWLHFSPYLCFAVQAAEQAQVAHEAKLIAFDRQNHMGISGKTVKRIEDAIAAEAATMHDAKGVKAAVNIKENEEKMKQLKVGLVKMSCHQDLNSK